MESVKSTSKMKNDDLVWEVEFGKHSKIPRMKPKNENRQPQCSENVGEATKKSMAANQIHSIHESIQSNMEAARYAPEYAEEGRELQRSEQQEWWTEKDVDGCWHIGVGNRGFADLGDDETTATIIKDTHNAALTAERQRREQAEAAHKLANELYQKTWPKLNEAEAYIKTYDARFDELHQQLLSALAAVAKYKPLLVGLRFWLQGSLNCKLHVWEPDQRDTATGVLNEAITIEHSSVDLSQLHEHDAEVYRKGWEAGHKEGRTD